MYPKFRIRIIASSLKDKGPEHFDQIVDYVHKLRTRVKNFEVKTE